MLTCIFTHHAILAKKRYLRVTEISFPFEFPTFHFTFIKKPIFTLQPYEKIEIRTINRYAASIRKCELIDFEHSREKFHI